MNQESKQAAEARRDAGMALATDKADRDAEGWSADARAALVRYAQENPHLQFLAEHVRQWAEGKGLVSAPENGRAWGSVFRNAAADGLIVRVGYAPADSSNRSPKCLWEAA